jgi:peroxiredoxin
MAATLDSIEVAIHQGENSKAGALLYRDIYTGKLDSLASLLGKVVLINVWAIGCPPCVRELPDLQRLQSTFRQKELVVLIVSLDDSVHQRRFFKKRNLRMGGITAVVREKECSRPFTTIFNPSCSLIDRRGVLKKFWFRSRTFNEFRSIIRPYL